MKNFTVGLITVLLILLVMLGTIAMNKKTKEKYTASPPKNGIIFQGGGFMSSWYAYVVDFDSFISTKYQGDDRLLVVRKNLKQDEVDQIKLASKHAIIENKYNLPPNADVNFRLDLSIEG